MPIYKKKRVNGFPFPDPVTSSIESERIFLTEYGQRCLVNRLQFTIEVEEKWISHFEKLEKEACENLRRAWHLSAIRFYKNCIVHYRMCRRVAHETQRGALDRWIVESIKIQNAN